MKRSVILGILFFGSLWGVSEVFLGEWLYASGFRHPSVPLNVLGLGILAAARACLPRKGTSLAIGCCAALYKLTAMSLGVAGTPFFLCHLLGIASLGAAYDAVASALPQRWTAGGHPRRAVGALVAAYMGYALFAFSITYVFRYGPWVAGGLGKVVRYIGVGGTLAAAGGAILAPLTYWLAELVMRKAAASSRLRPELAAGCVSLATAGLWMIAVAAAI